MEILPDLIGCPSYEVFVLILDCHLLFLVLRSGRKYGAFLGLSFLGVLSACRVAMVLLFSYFFFCLLFFSGGGLWDCALNLLDIGLPVLLFSIGEANRGSKRIF